MRSTNRWLQVAGLEVAGHVVRREVRRGILPALTLACALVTGTADAQDPNFVLEVGSTVTAPGGTVTIPVTLDTTGSAIQGWSFGICLDTAQATITNLSLGATALTVNEGTPPDFQQLNVEPNGWTMGVVICLLGCDVLDPGLDYEIAVAEYEVNAPAETVIDLCPCNGVGTPIINTVVVVEGISIAPTVVCGAIEVVALEEFVRGDANDDGGIDISDGIWLLNYLFQGGPVKPCLGASDANGDGSIDTGDPIYAISYIFAGGPPPTAPFPGCGLAVNQGLETCASFESCP